MFDTILQIQAPGNTTTEEGFNSDEKPAVLDENFAVTESIQLGELSVVFKDGIAYYVFALDVAESNAAGAPDLTLDDLKIYVSGAAATGADFQTSTSSFLTTDGYTEVFNLDGALGLEDVNAGNGKSDYLFYIPKSLFDKAGATTTSFVTLYSAFSDVDSSFEEWGAQTTAPPVDAPELTIDKVTVDGDLAGDGLTILAYEEISWKYTITNTGNVTLTDIVVTDDNGTINTDDDFTYTILSLAAGASEVVTQTGGIAILGDYSNTATATTTFGTTAVSASDDSSYFGAWADLVLSKLTNGVDDAGVFLGDAIEWTYTVSLAEGSNVGLSNITLTDDGGPDAGFSPTYTGGDDGDGVLEIGETWEYAFAGTAGHYDYMNTATATGSFIDDAGHVLNAEATDSSQYHTEYTGLSKGFWANSNGLQDWDCYQKGASFETTFSVNLSSWTVGQTSGKKTRADYASRRHVAGGSATDRWRRQPIGVAGRCGSSQCDGRGSRLPLQRQSDQIDGARSVRRNRWRCQYELDGKLPPDGT